MRPCIWFVVLYFYATAPKPRRHVLRYQTRLQTAFPHTVLPKHSVFKQFIAFGEAVCDRFAVWQRKIRYEDLVIEDPERHLFASQAQRTRPDFCLLTLGQYRSLPCAGVTP